MTYTSVENDIDSTSYDRGNFWQNINGRGGAIQLTSTVVGYDDSRGAYVQIVKKGTRKATPGKLARIEYAMAIIQAL